jgi:hypothetical protein
MSKRIYYQVVADGKYEQTVANPSFPPNWGAKLSVGGQSLDTGEWAQTFSDIGGSQPGSISF